MNIKQALLAVIAVLLLPGSLLRAYEKNGDTFCDLCDQQVVKTVYLFKDLAVGGEKRICGNCRDLKTRCSVCGLPTKTNYTSLKDGRLLCERDNREAIHSENEVRQICSDVQDELNRAFLRFMSYPTTNVVVSSVDKFTLENSFKTAGYEHCVSVLGATASHVIGGEGRYLHAVNLLSDMRKARLIAVCAHECTHTWLNENLSKQRKAVIAADTVEGFCEFMAYKLMERHREAFEMEVIKSSDYTKGQITALLEAENKYGFNDLLDWIKFGEDSRVDVNQLERLRALRENADKPVHAAAFFPVPAQAPASPAPTTLLLKGISGSDRRRFALINDSTFAVQERGKVRLGQTNVVLRCLEIRSNSVVVQLDGASEKKELFLRVQ